MSQNWHDLGNGQWELTITDDQNRVPPAKVNGTRDEIIQKLADSKINGDRRIAELKSQAPQLPAAERMQIVADLQNPARVDVGVSKIIENLVGPIEDFRRDRSEERQERETRTAVEAARNFADNTPDWYPSEYNKTKLTEYMKRFGMSHSNSAHYTQAFQELNSANLLQSPPAGTEAPEGETITSSAAQQAERTAPAPLPKPQTPTRYSTGVRPSDVSGRQPAPSNRLKYTREQIALMGSKEYREKMISDPELSKAVDYYARPQRRIG